MVPSGQDDAVAVLVCTRDRPASLQRTVRSLLASEGVPFELIVVDQSASDETERALAPLRSERLRYVRDGQRGKGAALNQGLSLASAETVVLTDDDCEVAPGWVAAMARTLARQETALAVFCNVEAAPHDRSAGYIPAYQRKSSRLLRSPSALCAGRGLGAGVALRRSQVLALGGFDEWIGPGAPFPSGDDFDLMLRALLLGHHLYETAELSVLHHGFRTFLEGRTHARRNWIGIGSVLAKPLRAGRLRALGVAAWELGAHALWPPLADLLRLRRPGGLSRILGFIEGFARGLRLRVDPRTLRFAPDELLEAQRAPGRGRSSAASSSTSTQGPAAGAANETRSPRS
jgi:glycosyltransferase involved in cell wall biosynthesis